MSDLKTGDRVRFIGLAILFLSGCAVRQVRPVFPSAAFVACKRYGYCSATAGVIKVGSTLCYTDHADRGILAKDQKCE